MGLFYCQRHANEQPWRSLGNQKVDHEFEDLNGNVETDQTPPESLETGVTGEDFEIEIEGDAPTDDPEVEAEVEDQAQQTDEDEADKADAAGAGDEVDDDLQPYSRKVQKRIMRERKIARAAIADKAKLEAELVSERARRAEAESHLVSTAESNIDAQISATKEKLKSAKENGDTDAEIEALDELDQLREDRRTVQRAKESQPAPKAEGDENPPAQKANPLTLKWLSRNRWMGDKRYAAQINATRSIDNQMAQEGWNPSTPEYFDELDRRIGEVVKVPKVEAETPKPRTPPRQSPVAGAGDGGDVAPSRKPGKVVLTKADLAQMRVFGLDPSNKEHLREFARNKIQEGA